MPTVITRSPYDKITRMDVSFDILNLDAAVFDWARSFYDTNGDLIVHEAGSVAMPKSQAQAGLTGPELQTIIDSFPAWRKLCKLILVQNKETGAEEPIGGTVEDV